MPRDDEPLVVGEGEVKRLDHTILGDGVANNMNGCLVSHSEVVEGEEAAELGKEDGFRIWIL
jgi:hypothetical protein